MFRFKNVFFLLFFIPFQLQMQRNDCLRILKESYFIFFCNDFESLGPFKSFWISLINSLRLHPICWKFVIIRKLSINITKMSKVTFQDLVSLCMNSLSKTTNKSRTYSLTMGLCHSWQKQNVFSSFITIDDNLSCILNLGFNQTPSNDVCVSIFYSL